MAVVIFLGKFLMSKKKKKKKRKNEKKEKKEKKILPLTVDKRSGIPSSLARTGLSAVDDVLDREICHREGARPSPDVVAVSE